MTTVTSMLRETVARHGDQPAARFKRGGSWVDMSWREVSDTARRVAGGVVARGVEAGARLGVASNTRVEWILADLGVLMAGCTTVPIYQSSTADDVAYIINDAEIQGLFVEDEVQINKLLEIREETPAVKFLVYFDAPSAEVLEAAGDWIVSWEDFMASGVAYIEENQTSVDERCRCGAR